MPAETQQELRRAATLCCLCVRKKPKALPAKRHFSYLLQHLPFLPAPFTLSSLISFFLLCHCLPILSTASDFCFLPCPICAFSPKPNTQILYIYTHTRLCIDIHLYKKIKPLPFLITLFLHVFFSQGESW